MTTFSCSCNVLLLLALACVIRFAEGQQPPHILFVVMDDLGFADLGLHGSGIQTPISDQLANDGLYLNDYYVLPTCTMTRIALMTGRFPYRMGQYEVVRQSATYGLPLDEETMAQMLRRAGYQAHAVGKWHLGHSKYEQTPTFRGFESFFGFYNGGTLGYFNHTKKGVYSMRSDKQEFCGSGCSEIVDERGNYSSFIYSREAARVINEHEESNGPLFLYLAFQAVHKPLEVPKEYVDLYRDNSDFDLKRKIYAGMLTAADEALGQVMDALIDKGLWNDTLLVYTTDNGGATPTASNAPLQGGKKDVWEGGVAGEGFLSGPALASLGIQSLTSTDDIFHAVDWLPTIASIANVLPTANKPLDGVDQLATLQGNEVARHDIFLGYSVRAENKDGSLGSVGSYTAFRSKRFKLVRSPNREDFFLYDLKSDREEQNNIAGDKLTRVQTMRKKMEEVETLFVDVDTGDETCPKFKRVSLENTTWHQPFIKPWCLGVDFPQPAVEVVEEKPARKAIGSISLPQGSPWCPNNGPTYWWVGHDNIPETPACQAADGSWSHPEKVALEQKDELNAIFRPDKVDRHDCTLIDMNNDNVMDIVCVMGANKGTRNGFAEVYITESNGSLRKITSGHGLHKYPTLQTRLANTVTAANGDKMVVIGIQGTPRGDELTNAHRMFRLARHANATTPPFFEEVLGPWIQEFKMPCLIIGDLNGDSIDDMILCDASGPTQFMLQDSNSSWSVISLDSTGLQGVSWNSAQIADIDGDGQNDLIACGPNRPWLRRRDVPFVRVYRGVPGSPLLFDFANPMYEFFPENEPMDVEVVDLNGDGHLDIYVVMQDRFSPGTYCRDSTVEEGAPVPPLDLAHDFVLAGTGARSFQAIEMLHEYPGCGGHVAKWGEHALMVHEGTIGRSGVGLILQWGGSVTP